MDIALSSLKKCMEGLEESAEWRYQMRRCMQEVIPGLFLGPYSAAVRSHYTGLKEAGITHIICVRQDVEATIIKPHFPHDFIYLVLDIADAKTENIMKYFTQSNEFIENCLSSGGRCLVHGNAGISRSAALVIAYIMQKFDLTFCETFKLVQHRRFCVGPNQGFMAQLAEFEPIYKAAKANSGIQVLESGGVSHKRKFDQVDTSYLESSYSIPTPLGTILPFKHNRHVYGS